MASKEMNQLLKRVRRQGVEVDENGSHVRVHAPGGIVTLPSTPSDPRSIANATAELRRHGVDIRHGGKKKSTLSDRQASALRDRVVAYLATEGLSKREFCKRVVIVGEEKGIRTFSSWHSAEVTMQRFLKGGRISKWAGDSIAATLNEAERPVKEPPPIEERLAEQEAKLPVPVPKDRKDLAIEWDIALESLERTVKLFRAAVRSTFRE